MTTLVALDIETRCGMGCEGACTHALDEHRNVISLCGVAWRGPSGAIERRVFRDVNDVEPWLRASFPDGVRLVGQNFKFDLKTLQAKGVSLSHAWQHDTQLMAQTLLEKIPEDWLRWYEEKREALNDKLPRGHSHRPASQHSLKTLAPYFLNVQPFWEDPTNHDNEEYCLKDCEYTLRLCELFEKKLKAEESWEFYSERL